MEKKALTPVNESTLAENIIDWKTVLSKLEKIFGKEIFDSWIKNIQLKQEYNHYVVLTVPTRFMRDWVVSRYADKILDIIKQDKKTIERIEFEIEEVIEKKYNKKNSNQNYVRNPFEESNKIRNIEESVLNYNRLDEKQSFTNFIVGESNKLAFSTAKKFCDNGDVQYNPLFIYGGVGMGKTHLLNAVGLELREKYQIMFISAERFMYYFIKSIKNNEMVKFKDFFRKADVFIIDDIQFVRGKEVMQEEFFHTFNALIEKGSKILISSDRSPSSLDRIQDRIRSRLSGGLVVDIQSSNFDLRLQILKFKYQENREKFKDSIELSDDVLSFLASEMRVNIRETIGALNRILAFGRIYNKAPSVSECKLVLKDIINSNNKQISIETIQSVVASYFKISLKEMLSPRRSRSLVRPRHIAMYLSKKHTTKSLPDIGRNFSNRDHTTVIHAVKTVEKLMGEEKTYVQDIDQIKNQLFKVS